MMPLKNTHTKICNTIEGKYNEKKNKVKIEPVQFLCENVIL